MTTWDEDKRQENIAKHGVDLALAAEIDLNAAIIEEDVNRAYGEQRFVPRSQGSAAAMQDKFEPLTQDELATIEKARAAACEKFKHYRDDCGEPSGVYDSENPPLTDEQLSRMRPAHEVVPQLVAARLRRNKDERLTSEAPGEAVSIHLDADLIERLRESGIDWQAWVNDMLRTALRMKG